jgi:hypothetical protein
MAKQAIQQTNSITYEEYPLRIADKSFAYMLPLFQPQNPLLDTRRSTTLEAVHRKMHEMKPQDTDFSYLTFYHQGSFPYSYEVEKVISIWSMNGRVIIDGDKAILTPKGETDLQRLNKEYLS